MNELITRAAVTELIEKYEEHHPIVSENRDKIDPIKKAKYRAAREILEAVSRAVESETDLPAADADFRRYGYLKHEENYRLVPCNYDVVCSVCGVRWPKPRGLEVLFCIKCGSVVGGLAE